jgi:hypothetical protein
MSCNINSITNNLIICTLATYNETADITQDSKFSIKFIRTTELSQNDNYKTTFFASSLSTSALTDTSASSNLPLRIIIGNNYNNLIGYLNYESVNFNSSLKIEEIISSKYIILIAAFICSLLFAVMISTLVIFKVRQRKQTKQLKLMQSEFENLESRVANECKEAFAELQMDIGELANTINQSGPPFYDFQTYAMKILFPNASENEKYFMTGNIDPRVCLCLFLFVD